MFSSNNSVRWHWLRGKSGFVAVLSLILSLEMISGQPLTVEAQPIFSAYTQSAPSINETIERDEWSAASTRTLIVNSQDGSTKLTNFAITLSIMNDMTNLYLLVVANGPPGFTGETAAVGFNFHNGYSEKFSVGDENVGVEIGYYEFNLISDRGEIRPVTSLGGTVVGTGAASPAVNGMKAFEISHPLCTNDHIHHFCVHAGDRLGFLLEFQPVSPSKPYVWPGSSIFNPQMAAIDIASPVTRAASTIASPVGGNQQSNQPAQSVGNLASLIVILMLAVFILIPAYAIQSSRRRKIALM